MKLLYMHFYVIYNSYYKDGTDTSDIPNLTVLGIIFFTYWNLLNSSIVIVRILDNPYSNDLMPEKFTSVLPSLILVFLLFFRKAKHQKIYEKYKFCPKLNTRKAKFIAFLFTIVAMASTVIILLIRNVLLGRQTISENEFFSSIEGISGIV